MIEWSMEDMNESKDDDDSGRRSRGLEGMEVSWGCWWLVAAPRQLGSKYGARRAFPSAMPALAAVAVPPR